MRRLLLFTSACLLCAQATDHLFAPPASNKAWAVVIGISRFQNLEKDRWLEDADADARVFAEFIGSKQGLSFLPDHVVTIVNEQATRFRILSAISTKLVQKVQPGDSVYIYFATHGWVEPFEPFDAYFFAYDTDRTELAASAVPFSDLESAIERRLARNARVMVITDACHSGKIADAQNFPERLRKMKGEVFGLLASDREESSVEGPAYGGGHGAFTYLLLRGLQGDADSNKDGRVTLSEATTYLNQTVPAATNDHQHPQSFGKPSLDFALSLVSEPRADLGFSKSSQIQMAKLVVSGTPGTEVFVNGTRRGLVPTDGRLTTGVYQPDNYRVMAVNPDGARAVDQVQVSADPTEVQFDGKTLWTVPAPNRSRGLDDTSDADTAQQILLAYLKGNAARLAAADFDRCAQLFARAQATASQPEAMQARQAFCEGRAALERRDYTRAATRLDDSIRQEPQAGYAYNARGLLKMAQNNAQAAIDDFQLASARAPRWPYPHFNAALAWIALGQTARAEQEFQRAIALGPRFAYLHYSLAGLYMRINQPDRAEQEYRRALELDLDQAAGHDALGAFFHSRSREREAETEFRRALQAFDGDVAARVNLAQLYRQQRQPRRAEQELLDGAKRVQSPLLHTALGDLYTEMKRTRDAAAEYRKAAELEKQP